MWFLGSYAICCISICEQINSGIFIERSNAVTPLLHRLPTVILRVKVLEGFNMKFTEFFWRFVRLWERPVLRSRTQEVHMRAENERRLEKTSGTNHFVLVISLTVMSSRP
jgi:hypothetical protein